MLLHVPQVLSKAQVQQIRQTMEQEPQWIDGIRTAGPQAQKIKSNLQIDTSTQLYQQLIQQIYPILQQNLLIQSFALPKEILPPLFNCYHGNGHYGNHVDSAIHYFHEKRQRIRTDVSLTLFLSEVDEYEGGELVIEDTYGAHEVKLDAGDAILYPSTSLHRVEPVTQGVRIAAFSWIQSMVKDDWQRAMLFDLDVTITDLRQQLGDKTAVLKLTSHYHNLLRQWAEL